MRRAAMAYYASMSKEKRSYVRFSGDNTGNFSQYSSSYYQESNFNHEYSDFLDNNDLLHTKPREVKRSQETRTTMLPRRGISTTIVSRGENLHPNKTRNGMEEFRKTANLYYKKCSPDIKEKAKTFFESLDYNNDNEISLQEFLGFMREEGHVKIRNRHLFEELDIDGNGTLDFMEVMTLYYIIKSGRPFCRGCDKLIPGMYFTCSKCFENGEPLFCVCSECFEDDGFIHEHDHFVDNYALLEAKRLQVVATSSEQASSSSVTITELPTLPTNALLRPNRVALAKIAYKAFDAAVNATITASVKAATAGSLCMIM